MLSLLRNLCAATVSCRSEKKDGLDGSCGRHDNPAATSVSQPSWSDNSEISVYWLIGRCYTLHKLDSYIKRADVLQSYPGHTRVIPGHTLLFWSFPLRSVLQWPVAKLSMSLQVVQLLGIWRSEVFQFWPSDIIKLAYRADVCGGGKGPIFVRKYLRCPQL